MVHGGPRWSKVLQGGPSLGLQGDLRWSKIAASDPWGSNGSKVVHDSPRWSQVFQDSPRWSKVVPDCSRCPWWSNGVQGGPRGSQIVSDGPKYSKAMKAGQRGSMMTPLYPPDQKIVVLNFDFTYTF